MAVRTALAMQLFEAQPTLRFRGLTTIDWWSLCENHVKKPNSKEKEGSCEVHVFPERKVPS
jgi:hypothetical protein